MGSQTRPQGGAVVQGGMMRQALASIYRHVLGGDCAASSENVDSLSTLLRVLDLACLPLLRLVTFRTQDVTLNGVASESDLLRALIPPIAPCVLHALALPSIDGLRVQATLLLILCVLPHHLVPLLISRVMRRLLLTPHPNFFASASSKFWRGPPCL